jgi:hypothetical protein
MDELPGWLLDFYLVGVLPEAGTAEAEQFCTLRYRSSRKTISEIYIKHRSQVIREAQRLGFVRPDEPVGEILFAKDDAGAPLPLPPGVKRTVEGEPSPWWASRSDPACQVILRQQLREQRGQADDAA